MVVDVTEHRDSLPLDNDLATPAARIFRITCANHIRLVFFCMVGLIFSLCHDLLSQQISLDVQANRNSLYIGESLVLSVRVNGHDNPEPLPELPESTNAVIRLLGSQSDSRVSIMIINGRMSRDESRARVFTYEIIPKSPGLFSTGPIRMRLHGKTVEHPGIQAEVLGIETQDIVIPAISASRTPVLVDEPFDIVFSIKIKRLPGSLSNVDPVLPSEPPHLDVPFLNPSPVDGLDMPDVIKLLENNIAPRNQPGFNINNYTSEPNIFDMDFSSFFERKPMRFLFPRHVVETNGISYFEYSIKLTYTPRRTGNYTFGPAIFKGKAVVSADERGQAKARSIFAVAPAITVRVVPPPEEGRPASFINILGTKLNANATLDTQTCKIGDVLKLTVSLSSDGRMDFATAPDISTNEFFMRDFRIYGDTVDTVADGPNRRHFIYKLRPVRSGLCEIPPLEVSYYDTNQRRYVSVTTKPLPLQVLETATVDSSNILFSSKQSAKEPFEDDSTSQHTGPLIMDIRGAESENLGPTRWNLIVALASPLLYGLLNLFITIQRALPSISAASRRKLAAHKAIRRFKSHASTGSKRDDPRLLHTLIQETLRQYVADRFDMPVRPDPETASAVVAQACSDPILAQEFRSILAEHFNLSYAEKIHEFAGATPDYVARAVKLVRRLERHLSGTGRLSRESNK